MELRARQYTSNLVTMGLANKKREITDAGQYLLNPDFIVRDKLEELLPIDNTNLLILRQFSKLKIYNKDLSVQYWPFGWALWIMLQNHGMFQLDQLESLMELISPFQNEKNIQNMSAKKMYDVYLNDKSFGEFVKRFDNFENKWDKNNGNKKLEKHKFNLLFKNRKSKSVQQVYYEFYSELFDFDNFRSQNSLTKIRNILNDEKKLDKIKKAFSGGNDPFNAKRNVSSDWHYDVFLKKDKSNNLLSSTKINENIFNAFYLSKRKDQFKENKTSIGKLLNGTGIFRVKNNFIYFDFFNLFNIKSLMNYLNDNVIFLARVDFKKQQRQFYSSTSLMQNLGIDNKIFTKHLTNVLSDYKVKNENELKDNLVIERDKKFKKFVETEFPKDKIFRILKEFRDRSNDSDIKKRSYD